MQITVSAAPVKNVPQKCVSLITVLPTALLKLFSMTAVNVQVTTNVPLDTVLTMFVPLTVKTRQLLGSMQMAVNVPTVKNVPLIFAKLVTAHLLAISMKPRALIVISVIALQVQNVAQESVEIHQLVCQIVLKLLLWGCMLTVATALTAVNVTLDIVF